MISQPNATPVLTGRVVDVERANWRKIHTSVRCRYRPRPESGSSSLVLHAQVMAGVGGRRGRIPQGWVCTLSEPSVIDVRPTSVIVVRGSRQAHNVQMRARHRVLSVCAFAGAVAVSLSACSGSTHPTASQGAASTAAPPVSSTMVIDKDIGDTLAAPSQAVGSSRPRLSPDTAWARYAEAATGKSEPTVPRGVVVALGSLSVPVDDRGPQSSWKYTTYRQLVYAYSLSPTGCISTLPSVHQTHRTCTEWTFLNADTGLHVLSTFTPNAT